MSAVPRPRRSPAPLTLAALFSKAARRLAHAKLSYGHGTLNAQDEALCLVQHALGLRMGSGDAAALRRPVTDAAAKKALALIDLRIQRRVPAAYLTNEAWLQGLRFHVDERVIVPRSYIAELLGEQFAPWLAAPNRIKTALDLCTGSGCLAIIMAKMFPRARIDAVDLSVAALAVARRNVAQYRLGRRIRLVESDLFSALADRRYDLIISNPPYVTSSTMKRLPPEYRREPALALAGGADGFDLVDGILRRAAGHLSADGLLVVEIGHHRRRLEATYPRLPFLWPETSGGDDCVFVLSRADLLMPAALRRRPARRRAI